MVTSLWSRFLGPPYLSGSCFVNTMHAETKAGSSFIRFKIINHKLIPVRAMKDVRVIAAGLHCEMAVDECLSQPCQNNATCSDLFNGFLCSCPPGFNGLDSHGTHGERKCADTVGTVLVPWAGHFQCWNTNMFSNEIYGSNFITQHSETVVVWNCRNADCSFKKRIYV